jgi:hypothetical protein
MVLLDWLGQRGFVTFLSGLILTVLYVVAVLMGRNPLELPLGPDGTLITPEVILNLLAPAVMLVYTTAYLFRSITTRVATQAIEPGDISDLFKLREFWLQVVSTVFAGLEFFNLRFWQEGQSATLVDVIVNVIMGFIVNLQASYSQRPNGATVEIVQVD